MQYYDSRKKDKSATVSVCVLLPPIAAVNASQQPGRASVTAEAAARAGRADWAALSGRLNIPSSGCSHFYYRLPPRDSHVYEKMKKKKMSLAGSTVKI